MSSIPDNGCRPSSYKSCAKRGSVPTGGLAYAAMRSRILVIALRIVGAEHGSSKRENGERPYPGAAVRTPLGSAAEVGFLILSPPEPARERRAGPVYPVR